MGAEFPNEKPKGTAVTTPTHKMDRNTKLNPVSFRANAYMLEPCVKSSIFLLSWAVYFVFAFAKARFSLFRLAATSPLVIYYKVDWSRTRVIYWMYLAQVVVVVTLIFVFTDRYLSRGRSMPKNLLKNTNLKGKVALVTGGYSGIGYETALQLLKWRCKVVLCGRDEKTGAEALKSLRQKVPYDEDLVSFIRMDLDDLKSVKACVDKFLRQNKRLDFLINNAGIYELGSKTASNGLEVNFSSNFLGHFYLTELLLDSLKKTEGRIISVSSIAHFKYDPNTDPILETGSTTSMRVSKFNNYYARSKMFTIWHMHALQRRMLQERTGVMCFSLAPGIVKTKMVWPMNKRSNFFVPRVFVPLTLKRPVDGAQTTLYLVAAPPPTVALGAYYADCDLGLVSKYAHDFDREEKLYKFAEKLVKDMTA